MRPLLSCLTIIVLFLSSKVQAQHRAMPPQDSLYFTGLRPILPQNFYNKHKGFMCKKESQLQKASGLNIAIRLGSKQYVDYLERKPNAVAPF